MNNGSFYKKFTKTCRNILNTASPEVRPHPTPSHLFRTQMDGVAPPRRGAATPSSSRLALGGPAPRDMRPYFRALHLGNRKNSKQKTTKEASVAEAERIYLPPKKILAGDTEIYLLYVSNRQERTRLFKRASMYCPESR